MKWLVFLLAALVAAVSLLTWVRAPDYAWTWKLAILAGEFSHWLLLLPLGLAVVAGCATAGAVRGLILLLCAVAAAGFLRPLLSARLLAEKLPLDLRAAFGEAAVSGPALAVHRLYTGRRSPRVEASTEVFARPDGQELQLDYYPPLRARVEQHPDPGPAPRPPCVVVIHGGGWDSGDRTQLPELNHRLARLGYAVAAIEYRLAPRWQWPAQKEDALAALTWLKQNAGRLGFDASRFVLLGRSAGAQIAEAVGYTAHDPAVRGVIAFYGPSDLVFAYRNSDEDDAIKSPSLLRALLGGDPDQQPARYADGSGLNLAGPGAPPTLTLHGYLDTLCWHRHDERLDARLRELGVPHYYLRLPWATHGFDFNADGPGGQLAGCAIEAFLAAVTK